MEADEVFSDLSPKISDLSDKCNALQGTIDSLQSSLQEQKGTSDKIQDDIQQIKTAVSDLKAGGSTPSEQNSQQTQGVFDRLKSIEDANAAAQKKYEEQQGLITKLSAQADDAAKTIMNFPDTAKAIANKAWEDGKKEILNIWEDSKKQLMNSLSDLTTKAIKDAKQEITDGLQSLVLDDVKSVEDQKPPALTDAALEQKIREVMQKVSAEK
jgi:chromosome segregation ATPase